MCWINYQHFNETPLPGVYECLCVDCLKERGEYITPNSYKPNSYILPSGQESEDE